MSNESLDRKFGLVPGRTCYREALIVAIPGIPQDDPDQEKIRILAEQDRQFCHRLQEDQEFRDFFWHWTRKWTPKSTEEKVARAIIDTAITDRVELVSAQKTQLKKYFHLLSESEKTELQRQVDAEVGFLPQFLKRDMPNFDELEVKCFYAITMALVEPENPQE